MTAALETRLLGKRYGRKWALRDCTLAVPEGRVVALVGSNGAGKSTLLHLAVGLLVPSAGEVSVFGVRPSENARVLADVGFVAQTAPLYDSFTVEELIRLGQSMNPRFETVSCRRKLVSLGIDLRARTAQLSEGERAQVALALALAKHPRLLILDEPVASLDPLARREFLQSLMEAVAEEGATRRPLLTSDRRSRTGVRLPHRSLGVAGAGSRGYRRAPQLACDPHRPLVRRRVPCHRLPRHRSEHGRTPDHAPR